MTANQTVSFSGLAIPLATGNTAYVTADAIVVATTAGARLATFTGSDIWRLSQDGSLLTLWKIDGTQATIHARSVADATRAAGVFRPVGVSPQRGTSAYASVAAAGGNSKHSPWLIGCGVVGGAVLLLVVIGALAGGSSDNLNTDDFANPKATSKSKPSSSHAVKYTVSGSGGASGLNVTYENAQGGTEQQDNINGSWSRSLTMQNGDFVYISVQNGAGSGTVTCDIKVDGSSFKHSSSTGAYVIADCSGSIGR